ncbi:MAG: flippase-like domain-containing protein [Burkholderiales bacterium]|nr:MAG: flippase-like domain-containing protein [Burkholderiales bacterium]
MTGKSWIAFIWAVIRLAAPPAIIAWLVLAAGDGLALPSTINLGWMIPALVLNEIALTLFGVRMQFLLSTLGVMLRWRDAFRVHLQSMFYFFIVPMTVGVEIARFAKIRAALPGTPAKRILPALLLDRMVGAGSGAMLAAVMWPFVQFDAAPWLDASTAALWICLGGMAMIGGAVLIRRVRLAITEVIHAILASWRRVSLIFVLSICMHVVFALGIYCAAQAFLIDIALIEILFAVAAGSLLVAIPVSLGGVGAADVTTVTIFVAMGHTLEQSILLGALPYLARLVGAVQGGVWEMLDGGAESIARTRTLMRAGKAGAGET